MKRSRSLVALAPIALVASLLTACSTGAGGIVTDANGEACLASGKASESIAIEGELGGELSLTSTTPVESPEAQRSVLIEGGSEPFADGEVVDVTFTLFNGKTGEVVNQIPSSQLPNDAEQLSQNEPFYEAVRCGAPGQRVAITLPVSEAIGDTDPAETGIPDLQKDDTFVLVFDFPEADEECEELAPREEQYPEVELGDGTSEPKITIPVCMEPPSELEVEVLVEGDGAVVESNQDIMTNYVGVDWNGAERFDGNWSETGVKFSTAQGALIDGFTQAMVGQKLGSTILVTIPPELGYGLEGTGHQLSGKTLTFVLQLVSAV